MPESAKRALEPQAVDGYRLIAQGPGEIEAPLLSIAISLKRIADALDRPSAEAMVGFLKGVRPEGTVR